MSNWAKYFNDDDVIGDEREHMFRIHTVNFLVNDHLLGLVTPCQISGDSWKIIKTFLFNLNLFIWFKSKKKFVSV
jgi:hypothetical protein